MKQHIIDTDELEKVEIKGSVSSYNSKGEKVTDLWISKAEVLALLSNSPQADGMVLLPKDLIITFGAQCMLVGVHAMNESLTHHVKPMTNESIEKIFNDVLSAYKPQADDVHCPVCNGNDKNIPCAYTTEKPVNCLRAKRLLDDVRKDAETAWLVEKDIGGFPNYLYCDCIGLLSWTPSNQKAMRFARKEDADSIVSIVEDADRVAQHMWSPAIDKARE